jgi:glycosyltransferase involved in cell wall biosynthesis
MQSLGRLDQEQVRDAYQHADVLLFPTRLEGLPLVAMEAMACGTPVVAHRASSLPEVITDGVDGVLCQLDDVDGFADAIQGLRAEPDRLAAMGSAARATAKERFCLSRMAREYSALFEGLIGEPASLPAPFQGRAR